MGGVLVRLAFDKHVGDRETLFFGQRGDGGAGVFDHRALLDQFSSVLAGDVHGVVQGRLPAAPFVRAARVDPQILCDFEKPAVHPRAVLKPAEIAQRLFNGGLNEIVGVRLIAGERKGEPPQARNTVDELFALIVQRLKPAIFRICETQRRRGRFIPAPALYSGEGRQRLAARNAGVI